MFEIICSNCKTILGDKDILFKNYLKKINLEFETEQEKNNAKGILLDLLGVYNDCCRSKIIGDTDIFIEFT